MKFLASVCVVTIFILSGGVTQGASVIDFEDWSGGAGQQWSVQSRGSQFDGSLAVSIDPASGNTTNALHSLSSTAKMTMLSGSAFSIASVDLQEGLGASDTVSIRLWANLPSAGGTVEQIFTLDGRADTYETFHPVGFVNVIQVSFDAYNALGQGSTGGFSIDDMVVPEPATLCLILVGTAFIRRRS